MVSETYVECLIAKKPSFALRFLKILLIMITVCFAMLGMLGYVIGLFIAIVAGVGAYFAHMYADIEYEYLYLDKEISIDRVMAKSRRKKIATYEIERMEILAPVKSYHLDAFKNRELKTVDYSSRIEGEHDKRYIMIYEGGMKIILEPNAELVKAVQSIAPRKVFTD